MLEKALSGSKGYWIWMFCLMTLMGMGGVIYLYQFTEGLGVTGMSRDIPWGFYIGQLTFMVGVAASAVMVVLPYYLHNYKDFGKITVLGEFVAIASVIICMMFVVVDLGQPMRGMNIMLHPTPNSMLFWDFTVLSGYLFLNILITRVTFDAEKKQIAPPKWIKPIIILSIPWAVSIHTVTAFLYAGLEGRPFWMTAILAPRFLASAFAAGPALLVLLCLLLRKITRFDAGEKPIKKLAVIATYALAVNLFFVALELFTGLYSDMPEHMHHFEYMFIGLHDQLGNHNMLAPFMWVSMLLCFAALILLLVPKWRNNFKILPVACVMLFIGLWIDKGVGLVITGFVPNPTGHIVEYMPTWVEIGLVVSIYATGLFILTGLYKIVLSVRGQVDA